MATLRKIAVRLVVWCTRLVVAALLFSVLQVVALRWVNPPMTWTMVESGWARGAMPQQRWLDMDALGREVPRAAVAAEDGWFWHHHGFDLGAIEAAVEHNADSKKVKGASTISQQVARNVFLWQGRTWVRKGLEAWYTVLMEALVPKARILEVYLNVAETGPNTFGMEAGARHWFGKSAKALTPEESARLVGILPSPNKWGIHGDVVNKRVPIILEHKVPFPGERGFADMAKRAPKSVGWRVWFD